MVLIDSWGFVIHPFQTIPHFNTKLYVWSPWSSSSLPHTPLTSEVAVCVLLLSWCFTPKHCLQASLSWCLSSGTEVTSHDWGRQNVVPRRLFKLNHDFLPVIDFLQNVPMSCPLLKSVILNLVLRTKRIFREQIIIKILFIITDTDIVYKYF